VRGALLWVVGLLFAGGLAAGAAEPLIASDSTAIDAAALIRKIETQYQGRSSHGTLTMTIRTRQWSRSLVMEAWSEGRDRFLTRILDPRKERGTCTLKVGNDIWNYFPRIDRLVKIPSSLMGDRWMGSHLTNDDLVKENKVDELYELTVEHRKGANVTILGIPRPAAAVVWGKIRYEADLEREVPVRVTYFDEENRLVRTMTFTDLKRIGGRWLPMRFSVKPQEEPDEETVLEYGNLTFDVPLEKGLFSIQRLRQTP